VEGFGELLTDVLHRDAESAAPDFAMFHHRIRLHEW
jgi:hypothetical protein